MKNATGAPFTSTWRMSPMMAPSQRSVNHAVYGLAMTVKAMLDAKKKVIGMHYAVFGYKGKVIAVLFESGAAYRRYLAAYPGVKLIGMGVVKPERVNEYRN